LRRGRGLRPRAHAGRRADDERPLNATLHHLMMRNTVRPTQASTAVVEQAIHVLCKALGTGWPSTPKRPWSRRPPRTGGTLPS
jgi:hypothetical protein